MKDGLKAILLESGVVQPVRFSLVAAPLYRISMMGRGLAE
jgi:hypothetical protein